MLTISLQPTGALNIGIVSPARRLTQGLTAMWVLGWVLVETSLVLELTRYRWSWPALLLAALWTLMGPAAAISLAWASRGKPEALTLDGPVIRLRRGTRRWSKTHAFDVSTVRSLRILPPVSPLTAEWTAIRGFWDRGAGRVAFDVGGRTYACGTDLHDHQAAEMLSAVQARVPTVTIEPTDVEPDTVRARRRQPGWIAYAMSTVLIGGLAWIPTEGASANAPPEILPGMG